MQEKYTITKEIVRAIVVFTCIISVISQLFFCSLLYKHDHSLWNLYEMLDEIRSDIRDNTLQNLK